MSAGAKTLRETQVDEAAKGKSVRAKRQHRIDHGMCPQCGREAAPYYLCYDCRSVSSLRRTLNRMHEHGALRRERSGRSNLWSIGERDNLDELDIRGTLLIGIKEGDGRLRPRMGKRPVDLDETLFSIFRDAGKPLTEDEVVFAWGRLRSKRKGSLASDMAAIIAAERRRERRRLRLTPRRSPPPTMGGR